MTRTTLAVIAAFSFACMGNTECSPEQQKFVMDHLAEHAMLDVQDEIDRQVGVEMRSICVYFEGEDYDPVQCVDVVCGLFEKSGLSREICNPDFFDKDAPLAPTKPGNPTRDPGTR